MLELLSHLWQDVYKTVILGRTVTSLLFTPMPKVFDRFASLLYLDINHIVFAIYYKNLMIYLYSFKYQIYTSYIFDNIHKNKMKLLYIE